MNANRFRKTAPDQSAVTDSQIRCFAGPIPRHSTWLLSYHGNLLAHH